MGSAGAKKKKAKNPVAGPYVGTTVVGLPVSYRITNNGQVVDFATTVTLNLQGSSGSLRGPCPSLAQATVNMPPVAMIKRSNSYPKGKRFEFVGAGTGATPAVPLQVHGKFNAGFRHMEGGLTLGSPGAPIQTPTGDRCRTSAVKWSANRVGGRK
jgi:hypothetical protein